MTAELPDACLMGDCAICPGWAIGCGCECHTEEDGWLCRLHRVRRPA